MPNLLSEDDIEQAMLQKLQHLYGYDTLNCYTQNREDLADDSNRTNKKDVILPEHLKAALKELNPKIPQEALQEAQKIITDRHATLAPLQANQKIYSQLRDGIRVTYKDEKGKTQRPSVKIIDFKEATNNHFLAVSQLWINGERGYCRPDILLYVNGIPLVFIELKNANVALKSAYNKNLTDYKEKIPQLFLTNAFCVLSNGNETRVGSYNAAWEYFFHWLRPEDETEEIRHQEIAQQGTSIERFLAGLCSKKDLLDYIENFILYKGSTQKIVAQNHQYIGVNKGYKKFKKREEHAGKLGVFWHTQGSGKSFSMIFYTRKIFRKISSRFTFVVITDREDLDSQIYRNFLSTGTVSEGDAAQPKNSKQMREFLQQKKRIVFTLIQKFQWPKGQKYPLLSDRDDIVVIVDEAHRTQYKTLAENMRTGLPNAQYLAFTGTPLLGRDRKTNEWFGDYVSEYNFSQSMNDGATVPLFYNKRVPQVLNQNEDLAEEFVEILEDENLDEAARAKLENRFASELEVISRDDRLETIARDVVDHFPERGYLGKGMFIAVDKFTAVKMYDKVTRLWKERIKELRGEIKKSTDDVRKERLKRKVAYMKRVEMAVVVSEESGEKEKFAERGLEIATHRKRLEAYDEEGHDLEHNFKSPEHPLSLVFVCAMWLTGFDAPTVSTLYLDKPQKDHTIMQTITRANRVSPYKIHGYLKKNVEKKNGEIIDYYGVMGRLRKAIKDYGRGGEGQEDAPVRDKEELFRLLDEALEQGAAFCAERGIQVEEAVARGDAFGKIGLFDEWADRLLQSDEDRLSFNVYANTVESLYQACKPEILGRAVVRKVAVFQYLRGVIEATIERTDVEKAAQQVRELLDESVVVVDEGIGEGTVDEAGELREHGSPGYDLPKRGKVWDLSKIDFEKLRESFQETQYKNIEIADLRAFINQKLSQMLDQNRTRRDFAERFQDIMDAYNAGSNPVDTYFEELLLLAQDLRKEEERHVRAGLSEDELEIYDILKKEKMTKAEEQTVRLAARELLKRLTAGRPKILVQDWYRDSQTRLSVRDEVGNVLDEYLPEEGYDKDLFTAKRDQVFELTLDLAINQRKWAA